ncbi:hypothetical protein [Rhizobium anhuiense]|uniref:hypothetical protein n=1 Tax=Rhizobium anhuiense TaxID=1184720 RepID=UPI0007B54067|nr:hypothetical protein [Rhizobium anhuiense]
MNDRETVIWEFLKRCLDTRRTVVLAALAAVITFGAYVINQFLARKTLLSASDCDFPKTAIVFSLGTALAWTIYLAIILSLNSRINRLHKELRKFDFIKPEVDRIGDDRELIALSMLPSASWLPFFLLMVIWTLLILPLEQSPEKYGDKWSNVFRSFFSGEMWQQGKCELPLAETNEDS